MFNFSKFSQAIETAPDGVRLLLSITMWVFCAFLAWKLFAHTCKDRPEIRHHNETKVQEVPANVVLKKVKSTKVYIKMDEQLVSEGDISVESIGPEETNGKEQFEIATARGTKGSRTRRRG